MSAYTVLENATMDSVTACPRMNFGPSLAGYSYMFVSIDVFDVVYGG